MSKRGGDRRLFCVTRTMPEHCGIRPKAARLEKTRTSYDMTHHFVANLIYEFPFGKGRRWSEPGR